MKSKFLFATIITIFSYLQLSGQGNQDNFWYFGNNTNGIRFSKNLDKSVSLLSNQAVPFGNLGSAVATDALTGNLHFYTDGINIYDRGHQIMLGGNNLGGDVGKRQPAVILPRPGSDSQYFVYFNTSSGVLEYVTIDMNRPGNGTVQDPIGEVINNPQITDVANVSDAIQTYRNGSDYWLIFTNTDDNRLKIYRVQASGNLDLFAQSEPFNTAINARSIDMFRDTVDVIHFAIASRNVNGTPKNLQLVSLDLNDISFSEPRAIPSSNNLNSTIEGVSWSTSGMKLYFSRNNLSNNTANIFQYDMETEEIRPALQTQFQRYYDIKKGPNDELYFLYQNTTASNIRLGSISNSDSISDSLNVAFALFDNPFNNANFFPVNSPSRNRDLQLSFNNYPSVICQNTSVIFFPDYSNINDINEIFWDFGGEMFSTALHPKVTFENQGALQVSLTIGAGGVYQTITETINITANEVDLQVQDTTICQLPFTYNLENPPQGEIIWSNGARGPSATFEKSGDYWVSVQSGDCFTYEAFAITLYGEAKQQANIWYFGDRAGIDFNEGAVPLTDGAMNAPEGTATISNRNGELLFYTDGATVWNKLHQVMLNGENIGGNVNAIQNSMIVPIGNDETLFYIFLTESVNDDGFQMKYALVDMKRAATNGEVILKNRRIFTPNTERVTAIGDFGEYQVLVHDFGNDNFRSYIVNDDGLLMPEFVQEGVLHTKSNRNNGRGYLRQTPDGNKIAVALQGDGLVNFIRRIPIPSFEDEEEDEINFFSSENQYESLEIRDLPGTPYGLSFSPSGNFLYLSLQGNPSRVYQFNVNDSLSLQEIDESGIEVFSSNETFGALQVGPNGQMYLAVNNAPYLYQFSTLELDANEDDFPEPSEFDLNGRTSRLGLPNFVANFGNDTPPANMFVNSGCENDFIVLEGVGTDNIDQFFWQIYRRGTSTILYSSTQQTDTISAAENNLTPGVYEASLRVFNECSFDTLMTRRFEVFPSPDLSEVASSRFFCGNNLTLGNDIPNDEGNTYLWNTGQTTREISVSEEGIFRVTVTSANGCVSEREIFVGPPFDISLGEDREICQGESITLDAGANAETYRWFVNGTQQNNNNRTFDFSRNVGGDYTIRVEVPDPLDPSCPSVDEVLITVNPFSAQLASSVDTGCGDNQGSLTLNVLGSGDYTIEWLDTQGNVITASANSLTAENLAAGNYTANITDNLSGCNTSLNNLSVNSEDLTISNLVASPASDCDLSDGSVSFTVNGGVAPYLVRVLNNEDGSEISSSNSNVNNVTIGNLAEGTYTIEISDSSTPACISSSGTFQITQPQDVTFNFNRNPAVGCGTQLDVTTDNTAATYTWTLNGNPVTGIEIQATAPKTFRFTQSGTYIATVSQTGFCTVERELEIILDPAADIVSIESDTNCDGNVDLIVNLAAGSDPNDFVFNWDNGMRGQSITVERAGTYTVTVSPRNAIANNCADRESINVGADEFKEPITLRIESENICDELGSIQLAAITNGDNPQFTWFRISNGQRSNALGNESILTVAQSGTYEIEVGYSGLGQNCQDIFTRRTTLEVIPPFTPDFEDVYLICPDSEVERERAITLNAGSFGSYSWRQGNTVLSTARSFTITQPGLYIFESEVGGCQIRSEIFVELDCRPRVNAPNAFRPSSPVPENRAFRVFANQYVGEFQIVIFNRWGRMVYRSNDVNFAWDGNDFTGAVAPSGTYAYKVTFRSNIDTNRVFEQRGSITLIR